MSEYFEKFRQAVESKNLNEKGQRNNNTIKVASFAKFFEIDESEYKSYMYNEFFGRDLTGSDKTTIKNAWNKANADKTYREFIKSKNKTVEEEDITKNVDFNKRFLEYIKSLNVEEKTFAYRDTSILKWFFKKDDWIQIVSDKFDKCEVAQDCQSLIEKEIPMKKFQLMSLASFIDGDGHRRNTNVKENRYVLLESDKLSLDLQKKFFFSLIEFKLPVKSIIFSGGKSYHCLLKIRPISNVDEYKEYCENIHKEFNKLYKELVDVNNKDGVRYSRSPFGYRPDKGKCQEMIWCDEINADDEHYDFDDTLEKVKDYVSMFDSKAHHTTETVHPPIADINGHIKYHLFDSLNSNGEIEDIFKSNGKYWIKFRKLELQASSKEDIWSDVNRYIDKEVASVLLEGKDEKHKKLSINDFYTTTKDIKFAVTLEKNDEFYNMYKPGFITECLNKKVTEIPSEFDKLLDNIADSKCKDWLINHLACHFNLILNNFKYNGTDFVLETVPVFYGKSGTGKNTFLDIIGQAISKLGTRYISIGSIADDFNEYYMAGAVNINEAAKGKAERRASKEALKKFTDKYQEINMKFMPKITALNTAYKSISANESIYGVLDIDEFDRRFQYITGGGQLNAMNHNVCDMKKLNSQKYDFISYLLCYKCDFDKAQKVFDNEAKQEDKIQSMSSIEKIAFYISENIDEYPYDEFSIKNIMAWYSEQNNGRTIDVDIRLFGKLLTKIFGESKHAGRDMHAGSYTIKRNERYYSKKKKNTETANDNHSSLFED